jgi:hypothetical protein
MDAAGRRDRFAAGLPPSLDEQTIGLLFEPHAVAKRSALHAALAHSQGADPLVTSAQARLPATRPEDASNPS